MIRFALALFIVCIITFSHLHIMRMVTDNATMFQIEFIKNRALLKQICVNISKGEAARSFCLKPKVEEEE